MNIRDLSSFVVFLTFAFVTRAAIDADYEDEDIKPSRSERCPWIGNKLKNGRVRIRSRGRIAKFQCNMGFDMVGKRFATCVRGQWNNPIPFCVAPGCYRLRKPANGKITKLYSGALLVYECLPGYALLGPMSIYCDGMRWSDNAPVCEVSITNPDTFCDFEDPDLCGWSPDPTAEFEWKRNQFGTPSGHVGTGPSYDHTFGEGKAGFYLYLEASSPRKENDLCRIYSPAFSPTFSPGCFVFWYHMHGRVTGKLRVYLKLEEQVFDELSPRWEKSGDQGNQWAMGEIEIPSLTENFQIIIEGVRGSGYAADTAIDDVNLWQSNCSSVPLDAVAETVSPSSCRGRCREQGALGTCECTDGCIGSNTCCSDYFKICTAGNSSSSEDGETPPPFVVTDYLNALTKDHTINREALMNTTFAMSEESSSSPTLPTTTGLEKESTESAASSESMLSISVSTAASSTTVSTIPLTTTTISTLGSTVNPTKTSVADTTKLYQSTSGTPRNIQETTTKPTTTSSTSTTMQPITLPSTPQSTSTMAEKILTSTSTSYMPTTETSTKKNNTSTT